MAASAHAFQRERTRVGQKAHAGPPKAEVVVDGSDESEPNSTNVIPYDGAEYKMEQINGKETSRLYKQRRPPNLTFENSMVLSEGLDSISDAAYATPLSINPRIQPIPKEEEPELSRDEFLRSIFDYHFPPCNSESDMDVEMASTTCGSQASISYHNSPSGRRRAYPRALVTPNVKTVKFQLADDHPSRQLPNGGFGADVLPRGTTDYDTDMLDLARQLSSSQEVIERLDSRARTYAANHAMPMLPRGCSDVLDLDLIQTENDYDIRGSITSTGTMHSVNILRRVSTQVIESIQIPVSSSRGGARLENGSIRWANGVISHPDGSIEAPDGTTLFPSGQVRYADGHMDVVTANGSVPLPSGGALLPNGWLKQADGSIMMTDGDILLQDGSIHPLSRASFSSVAPAEPLFEPCVCCAGTGCEGISGVVSPNIHSVAFYFVTTLGLIVGFSFEWAWDFLYSIVKPSDRLTVGVLYPILTIPLAIALHFFLSAWLVHWKPCARSSAATFLDSACGMGMAGVALYSTIFKITRLVDSPMAILIWVVLGMLTAILASTFYYFQSRLQPMSVPVAICTMLCSPWAYVTSQFPFGILHYVFNENPLKPTKQGYNWLLMAILPCVLITLVGLCLIMSFTLRYTSVVGPKDMVLHNLTWLVITLGLMFGICLKVILCPFTEQHDPTLPDGGEFSVCIYYHLGQGTGAFSLPKDASLPSGVTPPALYFFYLILAVIITIAFGLFLVLTLKYVRDQLLLYKATAIATSDQRKSILFVSYLMLSLTWAISYFTATYCHWLQRATAMIFVRLIQGPAIQSFAIFAWATGWFVGSLCISHNLDEPHTRATKAHVVWQERWRSYWTSIWTQHATADISEAELGEIVGREMERVMIGVDLLAGPPLDIQSVDSFYTGASEERSRHRRFSRSGSQVSHRVASFRMQGPNQLFRPDCRDLASTNYNAIMEAIERPRSYRQIPIGIQEPPPPPLRVQTVSPVLKAEEGTQFTGLEEQLPPFVRQITNDTLGTATSDEREMAAGKTVVKATSGVRRRRS